MLKKNCPHRPLVFQQLEPRQLLAADVIHFREGGGIGYRDAEFIDTYLASYEAGTTTHGDSDRILARSWGTAAHERALISVTNLFSELPRVSREGILQIRSARLHLFSDVANAGRSTIQIHRVTSDWGGGSAGDENTVSQAYRDLTTARRWAGGDFGDSDYDTNLVQATWRGGEGDENVFDVTSLVQSMYATGENDGFAIVGDFDRAAIASSENPHVARRPSLEIEYEYASDASPAGDSPPDDSPRSDDDSNVIHFREGGGHGFTDVVFDDTQVASHSTTVRGNDSRMAARSWGVIGFETSLLAVSSLFSQLPKTDNAQTIEIKAARLYLTSDVTVGDGSEIHVHRMESDWLSGQASQSENNVDRMHRSISADDVWAGGEFSSADYSQDSSSVIWQGESGSKNVIDVTSLVQSMYAHQRNEGFAIVGSSDRVLISSSEHKLLDRRPSLEIEYKYVDQVSPDPPGDIEPPQIAELPQQHVDTTYSIPQGGTLYVVNDGDSAAFQAALDAALPGDIIELEAGETFIGNFTIDNRLQEGDGWIHIRSSRHAELPAPGNRVSADHSHLMPKIKSAGVSGGSRALHLYAGSHHIRFVGIEVSSSLETFTSQRATNLVVVGLERDDSFARTAERTAHHIIFDRSYIHGTDDGNITNGIQAHARHFAVVDSEISNIHSTSESHAIVAYNGPGPYKIHNSFLQAAGIPVLFGGADPSIDQLVHSDIAFTGNLVSKDLRWKESGPRSDPDAKWLVKHLFELKNARRVLVDGNIFENSWTFPTDGAAILIKSTNQDQQQTQVGCTWCVTEDITIRNNIIRHAAAGIRISGRDSGRPHGGQTSRILVTNNLFYDLDHIRWSTADAPATGKPITATEDFRDVHFIHNTFDATGSKTANSTTVTLQNPDTGRPASGLIIRDNIFPYLWHGIKGPGLEGTSTLQTYAPGFEFQSNVLYGAFNADFYPEGNFYTATSIVDVGYQNAADGDYRLAAVSPYKKRRFRWFGRRR